MSEDILEALASVMEAHIVAPMRTLENGNLADVLYDVYHEIKRVRAREARLEKALQEILDMYGETFLAGEIALDALEEGEKG